MRDVGDEDEEESRAGRQGDQELEQVAFGEPISDGAASLLSDVSTVLSPRKKGGNVRRNGRKPFLRIPIVLICREFSFGRGVALRCKGLLT